MSDVAYMTRLPACDVCLHEHQVNVTAAYDAATILGRWAYVCEEHFLTHTYGQLGTGAGQRLVVGSPPVLNLEDKRDALAVALAAGDWDAAEGIVGDGDLTDWL